MSWSTADEAYAEVARGLMLDVRMVPTDEILTGRPTWKASVSGIVVGYGSSPREAGESLRRWMQDALERQQ